MIENQNKRSSYKHYYNQYFSYKEERDSIKLEINNLIIKKNVIQKQIDELNKSVIDGEKLRQESIQKFIKETREADLSKQELMYDQNMKELKKELEKTENNIEELVVKKREVEKNLKTKKTFIESPELSVKKELKETFKNLTDDEVFLEKPTLAMEKREGNPNHLSIIDEGMNNLSDEECYKIAMELLDNPKIRLLPISIKSGIQGLLGALKLALKFIPNIFWMLLGIPIGLFELVKGGGIKTFIGIGLELLYIYLIVLIFSRIILVYAVEFLVTIAFLLVIGLLIYAAFVMIVEHFKKEDIEKEKKKLFVLTMVIKENERFLIKVANHVINNKEDFKNDFEIFSKTEELSKTIEKLKEESNALQVSIDQSKGQAASLREKASSLKEKYGEDTSNISKNNYSKEVEEYLINFDKDLSNLINTHEANKNKSIDEFNREKERLELSIKEKETEIENLSSLIEEIKIKSDNFKEKLLIDIEDNQYCNNYKMDESMVIGFKDPVNKDEISEILEIQHNYNPVVIFYSNKKKHGLGEDNLKDSIGEFLNNLITYAVTNNYFLLIRQHLLDTMFSGIKFVNHDLYKHGELTIKTNDSDIKKLIDEIEKIKSDISDIETINNNRLHRRDKPHRYDILYMFAYGSILKDSKFKQLLKNNKEKGILPIIFIISEEFNEKVERNNLDGDLLTLLNEANRNRNVYALDISKKIEDAGYFERYDIGVNLNKIIQYEAVEYN
jgi:hypothetical protein